MNEDHQVMSTAEILAGGAGPTTQIHDTQQTQIDVQQTQSLVDHEVATHSQLPALHSPSPSKPVVRSEPVMPLVPEQIPAGNPGTSESGKTPPT